MYMYIVHTIYYRSYLEWLIVVVKIEKLISTHAILVWR